MAILNSIRDRFLTRRGLRRLVRNTRSRWRGSHVHYRFWLACRAVRRTYYRGYGFLQTKKSQVSRRLNRSWARFERRLGRRDQKPPRVKAGTLTERIKRYFRAFHQACAIWKVEQPQAPYPHLLRCNDVPTETEAEVVKAAIEKAQTILKNSQPTTTSLDDSARIYTLTTFIHSHRAILHPIRALPIELVQQILLITAENFKQRDSSNLNGFALFWQAGHICRVWRAAALQLPGLWDHVTITIRPRPSGRQIECMKEVFARCHRSGLSLELSPQKYGQNITATHPVIRLISQHASLWRSFTLKNFHPASVVEFLQEQSGHFDCLQGLHFELAHVLDINGHLPAVRKITAFKTAPRLTKVHVSDRSLLLSLPWSQITHYSHLGGDVEYRQLCTRGPYILTHLDLAICSSGVWPAVTFPHLEELVLSSPVSPVIDGGRLLSGFLNSITAPSLRRLRILNSWTRPEHRTRQLVHAVQYLLIRSSSPSILEELVLADFETEGHDGGLMALLLLVPDLARLRLFLPDLPDLEAFVLLEGRPPLLPHLTHLSFSRYEPYGADSEIDSDIIFIFREVCRSRSAWNPSRTNRGSHPYPRRLQHFETSGWVRPPERRPLVGLLQGWEPTPACIAFDAFQVEVRQMQGLSSTPNFMGTMTQLDKASLRRFLRLLVDLDARLDAPDVTSKDIVLSGLHHLIRRIETAQFPIVSIHHSAYAKVRKLVIKIFSDVERILSGRCDDQVWFQDLDRNVVQYLPPNHPDRGSFPFLPRLETREWGFSLVNT